MAQQWQPKFTRLRQQQRQSLLLLFVVLLANCNSVSSFVSQRSSKSTSSHRWEQSSAVALNPQRTSKSTSTSVDVVSANTIDEKIDNGDVDVDIVPFIVEELSQMKASKVSLEIADLVIKVFFEEEAELRSENRSKGGMTPWKVMQLAYLKNLQNGDVKGKKFLLSKNINNSMFVARQILPCSSYSDKVNPETLIDVSSSSDENGNKLFNLEYLPKDTEMYQKGPILGFVDVSEKSFGVASGKGGSSSSSDVVVQYDGQSKSEDDSSSPIKKRTLRPVLTNLSVREEARRSGVGSALVDACENVVMTSWSTKYDEMVLEVEEENQLAQKFYEKRGYVALYADPSSRRYDTSGIILRDVRTTKICYRKDLKSNLWSDATGAAKGGGLFDLPFFAKMKEVVGVRK